MRAWTATTSITIPANNSPNPVMTLKTRTLGCRFSNRTVRASKIGRNGSGLVCQRQLTRECRRALRRIARLTHEIAPFSRDEIRLTWD